LFGGAVPAVLALPEAAIAYAVAVEPGWIELRRVRVPVRGLPPALEGFRIAQLSDLHRSEIVGAAHVRGAVARALAEQPELVAVTGDLVTGEARFFDDVAEDLAPLAAAAPSFAVPGNHDYDHWYPHARAGMPDGPQRLGDVLRAHGIEFLRNESRVLDVRGGAARIEIVGLDDFWSPNFDPARAFAGASREGLTRIVLNHNPDGFAVTRHERFDLMLCGHTHGGQVRIPLLGAPICPVEDRRFLQGLVAADDRLVYTNRGIGYNRRVRFGVRPEVTLLELVPA